MDDRRPRRLERRDDEAVRHKNAPRLSLCIVDDPGPTVTPVGGEVAEALADIGDLARLDGLGDRQAPQDTSVDGERVGVGDRRDLRGCFGDPVTIPEIGEGYGPGAHQRTVPRGMVGALTEVGSGGFGQVAAINRSGEDRPGLVADVVRFVRPRDEAVAEKVEIEISCGGLLSDADRHLRVVGPFTRLPAERAATLHLNRSVERRSELVSGAEGVTRCEADEDTGRSVISCSHGHFPLRR